MTALELKYQKLDSISKKKVNDLIDNLLEENRTKAFDMAEYKKSILDIPTWTDDDVKEFEENTKHFTSWKVEEW